MVQPRNEQRRAEGLYQRRMGGPILLRRFLRGSQRVSQAVAMGSLLGQRPWWHHLAACVERTMRPTHAPCIQPGVRGASTHLVQLTMRVRPIQGRLGHYCLCSACTIKAPAPPAQDTPKISASPFRVQARHTRERNRGESSEIEILPVNEVCTTVLLLYSYYYCIRTVSAFLCVCTCFCNLRLCGFFRLRV